MVRKLESEEMDSSFGALDAFAFVVFAVLIFGCHREERTPIDTFWRPISRRISNM